MSTSDNYVKQVEEALKHLKPLRFASVSMGDKPISTTLRNLGIDPNTFDYDRGISGNVVLGIDRRCRNCHHPWRYHFPPPEIRETIRERWHNSGSLQASQAIETAICTVMASGCSETDGDFHTGARTQNFFCACPGWKEP